MIKRVIVSLLLTLFTKALQLPLVTGVVVGVLAPEYSKQPGTGQIKRCLLIYRPNAFLSESCSTNKKTDSTLSLTTSWMASSTMQPLAQKFPTQQ